VRSFSVTLVLLALFVRGAAGQTFPNSPPKPKVSRSLALQEFSQNVGQVWPEERVVVQAVGAMNKDVPVLRMRLRNVSGQAIKLYRFQLPWGNAGSLIIAATTTSGEPLQVVYPIDDPPPPGPDEPLLVSPGEKLSGEFRIGYKIPELSEALKKSDVLVMWAYVLERGAGYVTGVVVFRKRAA
jgi:hypothetical protein